MFLPFKWTEQYEELFVSHSFRLIFNKINYCSNLLHITYEDVITNTVKKQKLKTLATNAAFGKLKEKLESHKKVRHLIYKSLEIQPYLLSDILSQDDRKTLTALRSQCVKGIRHNFSKMYKMSLKCPLLCNPESPQ